MKIFKGMTGGDASRVKTFAQQFRASPYFLKVLTVGYKPVGRQALRGPGLRPIVE